MTVLLADWMIKHLTGINIAGSNLRMTDTIPASPEKRLEILKGLYPLYKEEVYRRREQMMRITALGSAYSCCFFSLLKCGLHLLPSMTQWPF